MPINYGYGFAHNRRPYRLSYRDLNGKVVQRQYRWQIARDREAQFLRDHGFEEVTQWTVSGEIAGQRTAAK